MSRKQSWEENDSCHQCDKLEKEIAELKRKLEQANFELAEMQVELSNLQDRNARRI